MRKNLGYISLVYFMLRASFIGISSVCLVTISKQDSWLSAILAILIGLLPIFLFYNIAALDDEKTIVEKIDSLFPKSREIIKYLLGIGAFSFSLFNFVNLTNLIHNQFLNNTPNLVISIILIFPIIYLISQKNKTISRISLILFFISIILILITCTGLLNKIEFENLQPFLEYNPTKSIIPFISYNILPCFLLLVFPNKYIKESIFKGYTIAMATILIYILLLISVLGIDLVLLFQYPDFHLLKLVYDNFISFRFENFLSIQWILDIFIFTSIGLKFTNESLNIKKVYIIPVIMIILNIYILKLNSNILTNLIIYCFPYVIPIFFLIIPLIIYLKQKKEYNSLKN